MNFRLLFLLPLLLSLFQSCIWKELENVEVEMWQPDLAAPLVNTTISAEQLIQKLDNEGILHVDSNQVLSISYFDSLSYEITEDLLQLSNELIALSTEGSPVPLNIPSEIASLEISNGVLLYEIENTYEEAIEVDFFIPELSNGQGSFQEGILVAANSGVTAGEIDLSGYSTTVANSDSVQLTVGYQASGQSSNTHYTLEHIFARLGNTDIGQLQFNSTSYSLGSIESSFDIHFFDQWTEGEIYFTDPQLKLDLFNYLGIPLKVAFNSFEGAKEEQTTPLINESISDGFILGVPPFGDSLSYAINNSNSNLINLLGIKPNRIEYSLNLSLQTDIGTRYTYNPNGDIDMNLGLNLPLRLRMEDCVVVDTFDIEFPSVEEVNYAEIKVGIDNAYPLDAQVQIYYADSSFTIFDSVFKSDNHFMESGNISPEGLVAAATERTSVLSYNYRNKEKLEQLTKIIVQFHLNTSQSGSTPVSIQSSNYIAIKLSARTSIHVQ